MDIPVIGKVTLDKEFGWYQTEPITIPVLGGKKARVLLEGYDEDRKKDDFHVAIENFLSLDERVLKNVSGELFRFYQDCVRHMEPEEQEELEIDGPATIWEHVELGDEPIVKRRPWGDKGLYVSLECNCDWEEEHGLQLVFKNGLLVNKLGAYDGHLSNADAYGKPELEAVVYYSIWDENILK